MFLCTLNWEPHGTYKMTLHESFTVHLFKTYVRNVSKSNIKKWSYLWRHKTTQNHIMPITIPGGETKQHVRHSWNISGRRSFHKGLQSLVAT